MSSVVLIAIPLLAAFISILNKKIAPYILILVSFALVAMLSLDLLPLETVVIGGFTAPYGINLVHDAYSNLGLLVVNGLFFLVSILSVQSYQKMSPILLVALAGLNGLLLTGDLFNLFVFIEVSGIAAYLITTTNKKPVATFNYLVLGTVGSSLYLLGLIILYAMFGTLNMADLAFKMSLTSVTPAMVALPFMLMFIGFGVEAKLLPFNSWVKGILGHANKLSGPMIASVYATAIAFVFGRVLTSLFVFSDSLMTIVTVILVVSIFAGEAMAYASTKLREILLFSSIAQAAIVVMLFALGFVWIPATLAIFNGASKLVLFLVVTNVVEQTNTDEVNELRGIFSTNKLVGASFTAVSLSLLGLPLFVGFVVKMNMLQELMVQNNIIVVVVILLSSVIEGVYFVKLLSKLWYKKDEVKSVSFELPLVATVVLIALVLIGFGLYVDPIKDLMLNLTTMMLGGIL